MPPDNSAARVRTEGPADLRDVIVIAILMASHVSDIPGLDAALNGLGAARRLSLDEAQRLAVTRDSAAEVTALSQALGS